MGAKCVLLFLTFLMSVTFAGGKQVEDIKADKPDIEGKPTEVKFFVFLLDIDDIDGAEQNFTVNVFIRLWWKDPRLAMPDVPVRVVPITEIWNPRIIIANRQGLVRKSLPDVVRIESDGTVDYSQRYVGPLSQPLKLQNFPFDKHNFGIHFISTQYSPKELKFVAAPSKADPNYVGGAMFSDFSVADWEILGYVAETRPYTPLPGIETAGFIFEFTADRYSNYYVWQVIIPMFLIVVMSWGALWIDPINSGTQIALATSSILTLIAYRFMFGNLVPRLPYMTKLDFFTFGSTILVFFMLIEVVVTSYMARTERAKAARYVDRLGRITFPIIFTIWSIWSFVR